MRQELQADSIDRVPAVHARGAEPALTLEQIEGSVGLRARARVSSIGDRSLQPRGKAVRMVALLFSPLGTPLMSEQILPRFSNLHIRSRDHIDFYFAGFDRKQSPAWQDEQLTDARKVGELTFLNKRGETWLFSDIAFDYLRQEVEAATESRWQFSGESDLLLLNAVGASGKWTLDFNRVVCLSLWHALDDEAIDTVSILFEQLIRYAEGKQFSDVWKWSDRKVVRSGAEAFVYGMLETLPPLKRLWDQGKHFAVR